MRMGTNYTNQDRGDKNNYQQYLEAMDAISVEKVASASAFFDQKKGNTIVDVGMASGTSTAILAQIFPEMQIIGVDINSKMVQIAQETYQHPNLSFREDDGEKLQSFTENTVNGFFNCSAIHHITSYNNYDKNRALNTLKRQVELLQDKGVLVVRDFVKPPEQEVILELSISDKPDRPNDCDLLLQFAQTARSLAPYDERGFPIKEIKSTKNTTRKFRLFYTDAVEFIRRKDYYANWDIELQEEYGYLTQREFENTFRELGLRIIISSPIYNQWIINNRYKGQFSLYNIDGEEIGLPPTNYLIAGEKVSTGKHLQLVRHLPRQEKPFLQYTSFLNTNTQKIYDVVERPNKVLDIIPFYKKDDKIIILAKHGYPRPLANVETDSPIIDNKHYSGYIPEGITVGDTGSMESILSSRFGLTSDNYNNVIDGLNYYTSPGGINERVSSKLIELSDWSIAKGTFTANQSAFGESGTIHEYNATQLLNTAQTGALLEARLELNIYNLLSKFNVRLPKWLGEKITIADEKNISPTPFSELASLQKQEYTKCDNAAGFLTTQRAYFSEIGVADSNAILEYVYPSTLSSNTLITLPALKKDGQIYVGLEIRSLPVPQIYSGNSIIATIPAKRLPKDICGMYELENYLTSMQLGKSRVERFFKLGEKYYPSIGVTTEQVYPYVVSMNEPDENLKWISLADLYQNMHRIEDAHLLICMNRLVHATEF